MISIRSKVLGTIRKYNMIFPQDKVVIAVSGGPDSTALLYLLSELRDDLKCSFHIAHLNHKLRGDESDADQEFVIEQAQKLGIPYTIESLNVKKMIKQKESLESGARRIRYDFYKRVISDSHANKLAQGHTSDDQVETVLMRLLRGSGMQGLRGIPPIRDGIYIRPLIETSRKDIESYLQEINIKPRWDSSNLSTEYERNKIRHELIPILEKGFSPNIKVIIQQTAEILKADDDFLSELTKEFADSCLEQSEPQIIVIDIQKLKRLHLAIQRRILRQAIELLLGDLLRYDFNHIKDILELADGITGKSISLPKGLIAEKVYDKLILKCKGQHKNIDYDYIINIPGKTYIQELGLSIITEIKESNQQDYSTSKFQKTFDYDKISGELHLRNRKNGDRFHPLGMSGTKKIKDIFIDEKIPKSERDNIPLFVDGNNIIWIMGYQISERVKVTTETKIKLTVTVKHDPPY